MTATKNVMDINTKDFEEKVIQLSHEKPVIVDFWAPWCGPCRMLSPVLEEIVNTNEDKIVLAKVNVDNNSDLAGEWGIRGIPAVKVFRNGEVASEFVGALSKNRVMEILSEVLDSR